jgi:hypothetical protein
MVDANDYDLDEVVALINNAKCSEEARDMLFTMSDCQLEIVV